MNEGKLRGATRDPLFHGFFLGGFECSCHRLASGVRLDLTHTTRHAEFADQDYARLRALGMTACRDGVNWVRSERPGQYDFSSVSARVQAARRQRVQVIWDLMHFGWPDGLDVFSTQFIERFADYAGAFASFLRAETDQTPMLAVMNEISFLAWAAGDVGCMFPFELARGVELKVQLVRACIAGIEAIRAVLPAARLVQPDPLIHIIPAADQPKTWRRVEADRLLQYQAWDMLSGRIWPELGGHPGYLDILGVNFYPENQFMLDGTTILPSDPRYKPFSHLLMELWQRYQRPLLITETGSEGDSRADWLAYVAAESELALEHGCELHGITLYPIVNHPGWEDGRHCHNGLWDYADERGERACHEPLAAAIRAWSPRLHAARSAMLASKEPRWELRARAELREQA
jgi:beta-glucosidase/6-phospho-beta-glucosidase/beta-galactosidase